MRREDKHKEVVSMSRYVGAYESLRSASAGESKLISVLREFQHTEHPQT